MPSLSDDGQSVTLDLHGARVDDAECMILAAARLAAERGRSRLTVIHGASTSSTLYRNRTIRHALYDLLDDGSLDRWVTDAVRFDGSALLSLSLHGQAHSQRLTLGDLGC